MLLVSFGHGDVELYIWLSSKTTVAFLAKLGAVASF